jgi:hypothetical protein
MRAACAAAVMAAAWLATSAAGAESEDIRDIRGPKVIASQWLVPALAAGALAVAAAIYGVRRWRRGRRAAPLSPSEAALLRLEQIRELMIPGSAREFAIAVSDIVRTYIEQRFEVTATHQTTEEFLYGLAGQEDSPLARRRGLLTQFLHHCDLAKFAGLDLDTANMESLRMSARAFVSETAEEARDPLPAT